MEHEFKNCQHCGSLNFSRQRFCNTCDFRLPLDKDEEPHKRFRLANEKVLNGILLFLLLIVILALTVKR